MMDREFWKRLWVRFKPATDQMKAVRRLYRAAQHA